MEVKEAEINPHIPKPSGTRSDPQERAQGLPGWSEGRQKSSQATEAPAPGTFHRGSLEGEEAKAAQLRGEGENKTRAGESPDLSGSDPQGLTVNGDS